MCFFFLFQEQIVRAGPTDLHVFRFTFGHIKHYTFIYS